MKKVLLFLCVALLSVLSLKAYDFQVDGIYYGINGTNVYVTNNGGSGSYSNSTIVIPSSVTYNGKAYPVTSIGDEAFWDCPNVTAISIPNSVISIGYKAFSNCIGLTAISIPTSIISIGDEAFRTCSSLASIVIPNGITSIGDGVFVNCSSLESFVVPDGVTSIGNRAFFGCSSLTSISLPNSVVSIGTEAFYYSGLTSISLPNSVVSIGTDAFNQCHKLEMIVVEKNNGYYCSDDGVLYNKGMTTLIKCPNAKKTITIPNGVISIENNAFWGCSNLPSVIIPNGVTSIGNNVFHSCSSLESVVIPNGITSIGYRAFWECSSLSSVIIPSKVTSIGFSAFYNCEKLNTICCLAQEPPVLGYSCFDRIPANAIVYVSKNSESAYLADEEWGKLNIENPDVAFSRDELWIAAGKTDELSVTATPKEIFPLLSWYSRNEGVAKVSNDGVVTGVGSGNTMIIAGINIDGAVFASTSCSVDVATPTYIVDGESNVVSGTVIEVAVDTIETVDPVDGSSYSSYLASSGLSVKNGGNVAQYYKVKTIISTIDNGYHQINFGVVTQNSTTGTFAHTGDVQIVSGGRTKLLNAEWHPLTESASGSCVVTYQVELCEIDGTFIENGPAVKVKYLFSDSTAEPETPTEPDPETPVDPGLMPTDNQLKLTNQTVYIGQNAEVSIEMINKDEFCAMQFDLYLPDGIDVAKNDRGKYIFELTDRVSNHSISSNKQSDGAIRVMVVSMTNDAFSGNDGVIINIPLVVSSDITVGEKVIKVANINLTNSSAIASRLADVMAIMTIKNYVMGDSNGDGEVALTDVVNMINYVIGLNPETFIPVTADANQDGMVDITDVVKVINIILNIETIASVVSETVSVKTVSEESVKVASDDSYAMTIEDFSIKAGETKTLEINMTNINEIVAFQFDVALPQGMSFVVNNRGKVKASLTDRAYDHTISSNIQADGSLRVMVVSMNNEFFSGNSGAVIGIDVVASDDFDDSSYTIKLSGIKLSEANATGHNVADFEYVVAEGNGGVDNIVADDLRVFTENSDIIIMGAKDNAKIEVYDVSGRLIYVGNERRINVSPRSFYVVKVGDNWLYKILCQ